MDDLLKGSPRFLRLSSCLVEADYRVTMLLPHGSPTRANSIDRLAYKKIRRIRIREETLRGVAFVNRVVNRSCADK